MKKKLVFIMIISALSCYGQPQEIENIRIVCLDSLMCKDCNVFTINNNYGVKRVDIDLNTPEEISGILSIITDLKQKTPFDKKDLYKKGIFFKILFKLNNQYYNIYGGNDITVINSRVYFSSPQLIEKIYQLSKINEYKLVTREELLPENIDSINIQYEPLNIFRPMAIHREAFRKYDFNLTIKNKDDIVKIIQLISGKKNNSRPILDVSYMLTFYCKNGDIIKAHGDKSKVVIENNVYDLGPQFAEYLYNN